MEAAAPPPPTTTLGTPASPKWDAEWLAEVDRVETELGRRVCGAHTPAWTPCKLSSTHSNGRCRFHGGAPGIGAPGGNRNAWIHGLYSRRLQQCGEHCPLWTHCPMAGNDVLALTPPERPHCVYEKEEYKSLLATLTKEAPLGGIGFQPMENEPTISPPSEKLSPHPHGLEAHATETLRVSAPPRDPTFIESNIALFQVLLTRAQAALGVARLTDDTRARTLNYQMHSTKIAALVQAQLHIARELRAWLKLLPYSEPWRGLRSAKNPGPSPKPKDPEPQGLPMRMMKLLEESEGALELVLGMPPGQRSPFSPRFHRESPPPTPSPNPA